MTTKVFEGWVPKTMAAADAMRWDGYDQMNVDGGVVRIKRATKEEYGPDELPPKRVTITVEVHD